MLEPNGVGLGINPSIGIETEDDPCGDDDILELRVLVSKLGRGGEMIKPTCTGGDGGGENGEDGEE